MRCAFERTREEDGIVGQAYRRRGEDRREGRKGWQNTQRCERKEVKHKARQHRRRAALG